MPRDDSNEDFAKARRRARAGLGAEVHVTWTTRPWDDGLDEKVIKTFQALDYTTFANATTSWNWLRDQFGGRLTSVKITAERLTAEAKATCEMKIRTARDSEIELVWRGDVWKAELDTGHGYGVDKLSGHPLAVSQSSGTPQKGLSTFSQWLRTVANLC